MDSQQNEWTLVFEDQEFSDFDHTIKDNAEGVGGLLRLTLCDLNTGSSAYGELVFDTLTGEKICAVEFSIDRQAAERVLGSNVLAQRRRRVYAK